MKILVIIFGLFVSLNISGQVFDDSTSFSQILATAKIENKKVLLIFGSESCPPCVVIERAIKGDSIAFKTLNDKFIIRHVRAEITDNNGTPIYENNSDGKLCKEFEISFLPVYFILEAKKNNEYRIVTKLKGITWTETMDKVPNAIVMNNLSSINLEETMLRLLRVNK